VLEITGSGDVREIIARLTIIVIVFVTARTHGRNYWPVVGLRQRGTIVLRLSGPRFRFEKALAKAVIVKIVDNGHWYVLIAPRSLGQRHSSPMDGETLTNPK
jgi:hypothetical protein